MANIKVIPGELIDTSPQFTGKAASVDGLATEITQATNTLVSDLGMLAALSQLASALDNYRARVATSMECFRTALQDAGQGLLETADSFVATDTELAGTFSALNPQTFSGYDSQTPTLTPKIGVFGGPTSTVNGIPIVTSGNPFINLPSRFTGSSTFLGGSILTPDLFVKP